MDEVVGYTILPGKELKERSSSFSSGPVQSGLEVQPPFFAGKRKPKLELPALEEDDEDLNMAEAPTLPQVSTTEPFDPSARNAKGKKAAFLIDDDELQISFNPQVQRLILCNEPWTKALNCFRVSFCQNEVLQEQNRNIAPARKLQLLRQQVTEECKQYILQLRAHHMPWAEIYECIDSVDENICSCWRWWVAFYHREIEVTTYRTMIQSGYKDLEIHEQAQQALQQEEALRLAQSVSVVPSAPTPSNLSGGAQNDRMSAIHQSAAGQSATNQSGEIQSAIDKSAAGQGAINQMVAGQSAINQPAAGQKAIGESAAGGGAIDQSAASQSVHNDARENGESWADHVRPTPPSDTQKFDWFGYPWDGVLRPAQIRDGRFCQKRNKRNIQCDGCGEWYVGNNVGGFGNDKMPSPHERETAWEQGWDARWYCIECWKKYWNLERDDEALERLGYAGRDSMKANTSDSRVFRFWI